MRTISSHGEAFDDPHVGLNKDQYFQVSRKMYKALYSVWDPDDATEAASEDWISDSRAVTIETGGQSKSATVLSGEMFKDAMFELADTWTAGYDGQRYAAFLRELFNHITIHKPPDYYFWCA